MSDTTVWLIALAFYAPLHYMGPVLVVFLTGKENSGQRKALLRRVVIDCTLSILLAFPFAAWLFSRSPLYAGAIFLVLMGVPYVRVWWLRRGRMSV